MVIANEVAWILAIDHEIVIDPSHTTLLVASIVNVIETSGEAANDLSFALS